MYRLALGFLALLAVGARAQTVVAVGGGERTPAILAAVVEAAGGSRARLVVVPLASAEPEEVGRAQAAEFRAAGIGAVLVMRDSADVAALGSATAVWFSGGDQNRLARALVGTEALRLIGDVLGRGGVVAGTSAGAAVMSRTTITGETCGGPVVAPGCARTAEGFGFLDDVLKQRVVVDQHVANRNRHGRLLAVVLDDPALLGVGIDEATALVATVVGHGNVTVITARGAAVAKRGSAFSARGVTLHLYADGDAVPYAAP